MCSEGWGRRSKLRRKARKVGEGVSLPDKGRKRALWRRASQTVSWQEGSRKKDWKSVLWLWERGSLVALLRAAPLVGRLGSCVGGK